MAFYFGAQHPSSVTSRSPASHNHHGGRSRRAPRLSSSQNSHKPFRGVRSMKELTEATTLNALRARLEAERSFDLDDDMEFCPGLLTEDDFHSIHSSSDRSSLSSNSPDLSPVQQQILPSHQATPAFTLPSNSYPNSYPIPEVTSNMKLHQPAAKRPINAIPIVNPSTGRTSSPPQSISPGRMQTVNRRWNL
ncbi:MAG: hypothetical protein M1814_000804 [Vezdaea aestivalis]|nr:MAG: hypothetical protein M1814_000804 [Vezdaea aestivalis]